MTMTPEQIIAGLRQVQEALIDLGACNIPDCTDPNCNRALSQLPAIIAAVEAMQDDIKRKEAVIVKQFLGTPPAQELTEDDREKIISKIQKEYADKQGKYRDMSIRTVIEAYEAALKAAGCKIVRG